VTALALQAAALRCKPPLAMVVQKLASAAAQWSMEAQSLLSGSPRKGAPGKIEDGMLELLFRGQALEVEIPERPLIVNRLLESCVTKAFKSNLSEKEATELLGMCAATGGTSEGLNSLQAGLEEAAIANKKIKEALSRRLPLLKQQKYLDEYRRLKVVAKDLQKLSSAVQNAEEFRDEAQKMLGSRTKQGSLSQVQGLIEKGKGLQSEVSELAELQALTEGRKKHPRGPAVAKPPKTGKQSGGGESASKSTSVSKKRKPSQQGSQGKKNTAKKRGGSAQLYCLCRRPGSDDDDEPMVQCDKCADWFHAECVGIDDEEMDELDDYKCPRCAKDYEFASALPTCCFCHRPASLSLQPDEVPGGRLLRFPCKNSEKEEKGNEDGIWAHEDCVLWCPKVYYNAREHAYEHLVSELRRGKKLQCSHCRRHGATIGCSEPDCLRTYHYSCAKASGCYLDEANYQLKCKQCQKHS